MKQQIKSVGQVKITDGDGKVTISHLYPADEVFGRLDKGEDLDHIIQQLEKRTKSDLLQNAH